MRNYEYHVDDVDIARLLMSYLHDGGFYESLLSFHLETGLGMRLNMNESSLFLQKILLQGRWEDVITYLQPLQLSHEIMDDILFHIRRQQYLEALSWHGAGGNRLALLPWRPLSNYYIEESIQENLDVDAITNLLKSIESHCTVDEFNNLCQLLTLSAITDDPHYERWTIAQGRLFCFQEIYDIMRKNGLIDHDPIHSDHTSHLNPDRIPQYSKNYDDNPSRNGLLITLNQAFEFQHSVLNPNHDPYPQLLSIHGHWNGTTIAIHPHINPYPNPSDAPRFIRHNKLENSFTNRNLSHIAKQKKYFPFEIKSAMNPPLQPNLPPNINSQRDLHNSNYSHPKGRPSSHSEPVRRNDYDNIHSNHHVGSIFNPIHNDDSRNGLKSRALEDQMAQKKPTAWTVAVDETGSNNIPSYSHSNQPPSVIADMPPSHGIPPPTISQRVISNPNRDPRINGDVDSQSYRTAEPQVFNKSKPAAPAAWTVELDDSPPNPNSNTNAASKGRIEGDYISKYEREAWERQRAIDRYANQKQTHKPSNEGYSNQSNQPDFVVNEDDLTITSAFSEASNRRQKGPIHSKPGNPQSKLAPSNPDSEDFSRVRTAGIGDNTSNRMNAHHQLQEEQQKPNRSAHPPEQAEYFPELINLKPHIIMQLNSPVRCVCDLTSFMSNATSNISANLGIGIEWNKIAIGTNNSSTHILRVGSHQDVRGFEPININDSHKGSVYSIASNMESMHIESLQSSDRIDYSNAAIATASNDKTIRIIRLSLSRDGIAIDSVSPNATLRGHNGTIRIIKFKHENGSPGNVLASAGAGDFKPRLWDVDRGQFIMTLRNHSDVIHGMCWDYDSPNLLVTGCDKGDVLVHDIRSGGVASSYNINRFIDDQSKKKGICCFTNPFPNRYGSPQVWGDGVGSNEKIIFAGCTDGLLLGFNLFDGRLIHCNQLHSQDIRAIHAVYPLQSAKNMNNMSYQELLWTFPSLITTSFDGTAALWRVNRNQSLTHSPKITGHFEKMAVMLGHQDKILSVCTTLTKTSSSFQRNIFTTGADGKVISWR